MAKVVAPLMSLEATGKFADAMVFQKGRGGKSIARIKKDPSNPDTDAQKAHRQKMAAGGKAIRATGNTSAGKTFLASRITGENTWATVLSSSIIATFDEVKTYAANASNNTIVQAFQTQAATLGVEKVLAKSASVPQVSGAEILIGIYLAFARNGHSTLNHTLATLEAGDAVKVANLIKN